MSTSHISGHASAAGVVHGRECKLQKVTRRDVMFSLKSEELSDKVWNFWTYLRPKYSIV